MIRRIKRLKNRRVQLLLTPRAEKAGKYCSSCGRWLPLHQYNRDRWAKDGHTFYCVDCNRARSKRYYATPSGRAKKKAYDRRYRRRRGQEDKETLRARKKAGNSNIRARRFGLEGRLLMSEIRELSASLSVCPYCLASMEPPSKHPRCRHLDHIQPMGRGGGNTLENVTICCVRCSQIKGDETLTVEILSFLRGKPCTEADVRAIYDNAARLAEQIKRNGKPTSFSERKDSP